MVKTNRIRILRTDAKERIISEIEKLGKEVVIWNTILKEISTILYINKQYLPQFNLDIDTKKSVMQSKITLLELARKVQEKKIITESKLNMIIMNIILSKDFKRLFDLKGFLDYKEINLLLNDIEESLEVLTFYKDSDISNFIIVHTKFMENNYQMQLKKD